MSMLDSGCRISDLEALVAALPGEDRLRFARIYHVSTTVGQVFPTEEMNPWLTRYFGSADAVCRQRIVKVSNRVTLEGALFNELRASRPVEAPPGSEDLVIALENSAGGPFCRPEEATPADVFGRIRGKYGVTASNVAKYDGWHAVVVFDEHNPLQFSARNVADYVDTAQSWMREAHASEPQACYPFFLWNCLWRSGASILHGHAQITVTRGMHYVKVESWRQSALRYRSQHGVDYFADLVAIHNALGLAIQHGTATVLPSLTPFKEKETHIISPSLNDDLKYALYRVLNTFVRHMGVQSFNVALYQPPLSRVDEDWEGFPFVFRVVDRGDLQSRTSDVGAMEFFAQSVVAFDPFRVADAVRAHAAESGGEAK